MKATNIIYILLVLIVQTFVLTMGPSSFGGDSVDTKVNSFSEKQNELQFEQALNNWQEHVDSISKSLGDIKHAPQLVHHNKKTQYVVVFTHGLYESPFYLKGITAALYDRGYNVLLPLLPGHWTKQPRDADLTQIKDWQAEINTVMAFAKQFGENVIIAGYSVGGELALEKALEKDLAIKAMLLWAPAFGLSLKSHLGISLGRCLDITGNSFSWIGSPDGVDVPYYSPQLGKLVIDLEKDVFKKFHIPESSEEGFGNLFKIKTLRQKIYNQIKIPVFIASAKKDTTVSNDEIELFYKSIAGVKVNKIYTNTTHVGLTKSKDDILKTKPNEINPEFSVMIQELNSFLDSNL